MNRADVDPILARLRDLGQDCVSAYHGHAHGYVVFVRTAGQQSVVLETPAEAERLCAGLEAKMRKEAKLGA